MPWATLITGCLAGTVFLAVLAHAAQTSGWLLDQGTVRLAFLPPVAAAKRERGMPGPYEEPALLMRRAPDTDTSWLDVTTFGRIFGN